MLSLKQRTALGSTKSSTAREWLSASSASDKHTCCTSRAAVSELAPLSSSGSSLYAVHVDIKQRPVAAPPQSVPVKHSLAYLEHSFRSGDQLEWRQSLQEPEVKSFQGNALEWALYKADLKLTELEHNPMPGQQAVFELSRGPVGQAATQSVEAAAKLTMQATAAAAKAALPVGQWALKQGTKAAIGLFQMAATDGVRREGKKK